MSECAHCRAPAGRFVCRRVLKPTDHTDYIVLGAVDPGPGWWERVRAAWDVSDASRRTDWLAPERIDLVPVVPRGEERLALLCAFCREVERRRHQPALFGTD